jgi:peptidyl-prolyl cis-trans isomerase C
MKVKGVWTSIIILTLMISLPAWAEEKKESKENAAIVNGKVITKQDLDEEMKPVLQRMEMQGTKSDDANISEMQKKILENLIDRELLYQECQKKGIKTDDAKVEEQLAGFKSRFADESQFKDALENMGTTEESIKKQIKEQMSIQELIDNHVGRDIKVSEADTKAYYDNNPQFFKQPEQVKASHILIKAEPDADDAVKAEARKKIEDIQKKLKQGGNFAALAKELSEGPSGKNGGELGFFRRGQMVKPFEDAAFTVKPGELSDIVETRFGYHIIKVEEKKPESITPYADVKERLEQVLKQQKVREELIKYLDSLKKEAKIEIFM